MRLFGKGGSLSNAMAPENNMRTSMALMGLGSVLQGRDAMPSIAGMMALDEDEKRRKELEANRLRASALIQGMGFYGGQPMAAPGTVPGAVPTMPVSQDAGDPRRAMFPTGSEYGSTPDVASYIQRAAAERGIDPSVALRVAQSEGLNADPAEAWQSNVIKDGKRERSYGPFQLYIDGGLGNEFMRDTGLDPRDASTWKAQVDYALDHAKENGWGAWYGAANTGIGDWDGIKPGGRMAALSVTPNYPPGSVEVAQARGIDPALMELLMMPDEVVPPAIKQLLISRAQPPKDNRTAMMRNVADLMALGYPRDKAIEMSRGGVMVNNNMGPQGVDYGKPEAGLVWQRNEDGSIALDERGAPIAIPYQGGEVWRKQQEAEAKAEGRDASKGMYADVVLDELGRAKELILNDQEIPLLGSGTTGLWGGIASMVDSTNAGAVRNMLTTVRANVGFSRLQEMRANSPTGGALGQVSNLENRLLQATLGSLEQAQDKQVLLYNIDRLEKIYKDIVHGIPDPEAPGGRRKYTDEELGAMLGEIDPLGLFK